MTRSSASAGLMACMLLGFACSLAWGRPGVLVTRQGQTLNGDIKEQDQTYVVTIRGIDTIVQRRDVVSVEFHEDVEKQFQEKLARLGPKDVKGRIELARWAFDRDQYDLARKALEAARAIEPNNADATRMLETVQSQIRLERAAQTRPAGAAPRAPSTSPSTQPTGPATTSRHLLTADDINIIRQLEINPKQDTQLRVTFNNDVRKRFITEENLNPASFASLRPQEQALRILDYGTPQMRRDVQIMSDPAAMLEYRRVIQPLVLQNCATSNCHGGTAGGAGGLFLFSPADNDAMTYTNFYILQSYRQPGEQTGGVFGGADLRMIDRASPRQSLLVHYALPPTIAEFDHPDVRGYRPALRNRDDPNYARLLDWITFALVPTREASDYGIDYQPPGRTAATRPATAPATQPASDEAPTAQPAKQ
jgi:hypothetical protein